MDFSQKYPRQISLENFGEKGQKRLGKTRVCIVGAGGVGSGAIPLLAACGLKKLSILDFDKVSESNLHRQTIYKLSDVSKPKARLAAKFCQELNPQTDFEAHIVKIEDSPACEKYFSGADIVIDACDSFASRSAVSEICRRLKKPVIMAAAGGYVSQITLLNEGFYFGELVGDASAKKEGAEGRPIFPPAAALSGVLAAGVAIKSAAQNLKIEGGRFLNFDHVKMKFFEGSLLRQAPRV
ncbi:MAG: ThiF family adenylyltransferase [Opitutales bacterium]|nr:ThiF family adenylyltransferase [Opitutales bacterium]